jgi:hypothetical protein
MSGDFWTNGYCLVPGLINAKQRALIQAGMEASEQGDRMHGADNKVQQGALDEYKPLPAELVARNVMPQLEAAIGRPLLPTYSFWRIYSTGMELKPHRDRNSCEISVSVPIHSIGTQVPWPLCLKDLNGVEQAPPLAPGDGLLYQGCKVKHWRTPFQGTRQYQLFLHYVIADGANANLAFDQRPA